MVESRVLLRPLESFVAKKIYCLYHVCCAMRRFIEQKFTWVSSKCRFKYKQALDCQVFGCCFLLQKRYMLSHFSTCVKLNRNVGLRDVARDGCWL